MISDLDSLVFSLHHNRGVYALLLGSGVSRAAQIPTGWEVIQDLVRKLAKSQGEESPDDPAKWYRDKVGKEPDYSDLLEKLAPSSAERQSLLRPYFEPTDKEREEGIKLPTKAHEAIARLVRDGVIRVILTTNFDRLVEQALRAEGVHPTVVSTPDAIEGTPPLAHLSDCLVVKLHGDYRDSRIRNTASELEKYDPRQDELLDRVFDEFGLVVAGWSGEWDTALYAALERCKARRYMTYWAAYQGKLTEKAKELIQLRRGRVLEVEDADTFFETVAEKVEAWQEFDRPHPISKEIAVARLKKYLPEDRHRIRLHDLLHEETERAYERLFDDSFSMTAERNSEEFRRRLEHYEASTETLEALLAIGPYWGSQGHAQQWLQVLGRIGTVPEPMPQNDTWRKFLWYPSTRLIYVAGLSALAADKYADLWALLTEPTARLRGEEPLPLLLHACPARVDGRLLNEMEGASEMVPVSNRLHRTLRDDFRFAAPGDEGWNRLFDRFEFLQALTLAYLTKERHPFTYAGRFGRSTRFLGLPNELTEEIYEQGENWPPLQEGFMDGSMKALNEAVTIVEQHVQRMGF